MIEGTGVSYIEEVLPDIKKAAYTVAKKWPQATTEEDLFHDLVVHFLERDGSLEKLADLDPGARLGWIIRIGHQVASAARDDYSVFSGQFNYSVDEVRKLLQSDVLKGSSTKFVVAVTDLATAMKSLKKKNVVYYDAIIQKYKHGVDHPRGSSEARRVYRAVDSLTLKMNRLRISETYEYLNGGRRRVVVSNAAAVGIGEYNYDGFTEEESYISDVDTDRYDLDEETGL